MSKPGPVCVEEHVHGDTVWVAIRSRGAEWSWFTREEAARMARDLLDRYGETPPRLTAIAAE